MESKIGTRLLSVWKLEIAGMKHDWFVVQTNPQRETTAADRLADYDPYFPRFKAPTGKVKPLFPGYLFCRATAFWSSIRNAIGVRSILMNGDNPALLPHAAVEFWRSKEAGGLVQLPAPPRFLEGQRLVITKGSLTHRVVIHAGMSAKNRELVLIEMLGTQVRITIDTQDLVTELEQRTTDSLRENRKKLIRSRARSF